MARFTVMPESEAPASPPVEPAAPPPPGEAPGGRYTVVNHDAPSPFLRGLLQGATLEWGDEIGGVLGGDVEKMRAATRAAANADPRTYQAGKLLGAFGTSIVPAGWILKGVQAGRGLVGAARAGATVGGITGAVEGAGEYETPRERQFATADMGGRALVGGAAGALGGAVLAPALYSVGSGVRAGGRYLYDWAQGGNNAALRKTVQALERQGTDPTVLAARLTDDAAPAVQNANPRVLVDVLRGLQNGGTATDVAKAVNARHGTTLSAQEIGRLSAGFDRANPVPRDLIKLSEEVGGGEAGRSGLTSLMQGVATLPGRGREVALRNMGRTMEDAPERMGRRLAGETGTDLNFRRELASREASRKAAANKTYGDAYQESYTGPMAAALGGTKPPLIGDQITPVLGRYALQGTALGGERQSHIASALQIMGGARDAKGGKLGITSLEQFHTARKELDKMLSTLRNSPNAADRDAARIVGELRRELNAAVYAHNPKFKAADEGFASDMAREEAMRLGRSLNFRSGEAQDEVLAAIRQLEGRHPTHAEELRDNFMQGVMRRMADEIETSGGIPTRWVQPLTGGVRPSPQRALEEALGAPLPGAQVAARGNRSTGATAGQPVPYQAGRATAQGVTGVLDDEARLRKIFTDVWGNSNTANKLAAQEDLRELPAIASEMATGGWLTGIRRAVVDRLVRAMTERNTEQIAKIVTETDPRVLYVALQDMQRMAPRMRLGEQAIATPSGGGTAGITQLLTGP